MSPPSWRAVLDHLRSVLSPAWLGLLAIVVLGLLLRLENNDYGLPYVYSADEGSHFSNRAVEMFGGNPNPGYFQNPSAFTYLLHLVLRLRDFGLWPIGPLGVPEQFALDPTPIWITGRTVAAVLCIAGVIGLFLTARRLYGARVAVAAAAVLAFAFLPVAYSRIAVTDVGTFLPVALSVMWAVAAAEGGERREFLLSGAAAGVAIGFKYTAGLVLLPVVIAAGLRARAEPRAPAWLGGALGCAVLGLLVTTPFLLLDPWTARRQILAQAATAGEFEKVGQGGALGLLHYIGSLGWGLGWIALGLAVLGAITVARRDRGRAAMLLIFPLVLVAYLSLQARYFGRWLLPAYPVIALLAGVGTVRAAELLAGAGHRLRLRPALAFGLVLGLALAQPIAADVRSATVLGQTDTRAVARDFLTERLRPAARVVVEPGVPDRYFRGQGPRGTSDRGREQFVPGHIRRNRESRLDYARTLAPAMIDRYRRTGFCTVMTFSLLRGRAERDRRSRALAYYRRLERESRVLLEVDPYWPGARRVPFDFDLSYNYYSRSYQRPGPEIRIYRLAGCRQGYGPVAGVEPPAIESAS